MSEQPYMELKWIEDMAQVLPHELRWMRVLDVAAGEFSTCAKRQYAAVVVAPNRRVVGFGYNGSPPGVAHCADGACPRLHEGSDAGSAYDNCISQHAEAGALLWSEPALRQGSTIIVNGSPCMGCAKLIASSGIKRVVYAHDESYAHLPSVLSLLREAKIEYVAV